MVATEITVLKPTINNGIVALAASYPIDATNGNTYVNDGQTGVFIINTDGSAATLDVSIATTKASSTGKTKTITLDAIADGNAVFINFLDHDFDTNGKVTVTYNGASGTSTDGLIVPVSPTISAV